MNFYKLVHTKVTPLEIKIKKTSGASILSHAFYYDELALDKIMAFYNKNFKVKIFSYYAFLSKMAEITLNYKDLNLMENMIALFLIKNKRELLRVRFSEYASRYSKWIFTIMSLSQNKIFPKFKKTQMKPIKKQKNRNRELKIS